MREAIAAHRFTAFASDALTLYSGGDIATL